MSTRATALWDAGFSRTLSLLGTAALLAGCVGDAGATRTDLELRSPVRDGFEKIADALQPSCGTLDCHGQVQRNWRLFGGRGLRLASADTSSEGETTPPEYETNYWATLALEPEILSDVLGDNGADPERWIVIRKGRGTTRHKGGTLMHPNDNLDQCLIEWLRGVVADGPCAEAAKVGPEAAP